MQAERNAQLCFGKFAIEITFTQRNAGQGLFEIFIITLVQYRANSRASIEQFQIVFIGPRAAAQYHIGAAN